MKYVGQKISFKLKLKDCMVIVGKYVFVFNNAIFP